MSEHDLEQRVLRLEQAAQEITPIVNNHSETMELMHELFILMTQMLVETVSAPPHLKKQLADLEARFRQLQQQRSEKNQHQSPT